MTVVRRRLFWKIYATLVASLVAATVFMGAVFWFLDEAQRDVIGDRASAEHAVSDGGADDVSLYAKDGTLVSARGRPIAVADYVAGRHGGHGRMLRVDLPDGGFVLARFGPPVHARGLRILIIILVVAGSVGLAAYPVTALLTRRLEALRAGMTRWGEGMTYVRLDDRGADEVALLARTFNAAASRLAAMLASQKALLANASHELRSPLARLRVAVEVGLPETEAATHREIVQNLAEIDQLVDELLLSSQLDHPGSRRDRRETIDLLGLAAEEAARYGALVEGEPVDIVGDATLLRRMIRNLLENGAKHGRPPLSITVSPGEGGAEIVVSDNGTGIALEERGRIFEPFYRPAGSVEASGGWGLGLALVRQIAERHGGSVECDDAAMNGSRFIVRLRAA